MFDCARLETSVVAGGPCFWSPRYLLRDLFVMSFSFKGILCIYIYVYNYIYDPNIINLYILLPYWSVMNATKSNRLDTRWPVEKLDHVLQP